MQTRRFPPAEEIGASCSARHLRRFCLFPWHLHSRKGAGKSSNLL
ncbi:hypothetical protein Mesau_03073 [Mesorhizobium australicum WSM2073]|uniref:Uncharacterized protein n=1 Tax=Mesorhizobium australicum (strain HAMBI 3006 / LMG 24608 / WSM2073) TaxID=754035 RepID=L0KN82_MESAW|nr:hypothetical protein Mesau_03073 [Mesorhizobium australicum WSM2073]